MTEKARAAALDEVRRKVVEAKFAVFAAQDAASEIADPQLTEELRTARHRLEAADRRQATLRDEGAHRG